KTVDPGVIKCRPQQQRNLLTTLFLAQGVPMLLMGDELGRTQTGNNNAYCQDNELSWVNWAQIDRHLLDITCWLIALRRDHPVFRRRRWFQGHPIRGTVDIGWFKGSHASNSSQAARLSPAVGSRSARLDRMDPQRGLTSTRVR